MSNQTSSGQVPTANQPPSTARCATRSTASATRGSADAPGPADVVERRAARRRTSPAATRSCASAAARSRRSSDADQPRSSCTLRSGGVAALNSAPLRSRPLVLQQTLEHVEGRVARRARRLGARGVPAASSSCSPIRSPLRRSLPSPSTPRYAPSTRTLPLMHGSTSPPKCDGRPCTSRPAREHLRIATRTGAASGSAPDPSRVCRVAVDALAVLVPFAAGPMTVVILDRGDRAGPDPRSRRVAVRRDDIRRRILQIARAPASARTESDSLHRAAARRPLSTAIFSPGTARAAAGS